MECHATIDMPEEEPYDHRGYKQPFIQETCAGCHPFHERDFLATTEKLSFDGINVDDDDDSDSDD